MGVKRDLDAAGMSVSANNITEDEAALYDRQIRLWGLECQKRLREAKILVIGLNGLGAEVVKNLALSGVKSITIVDDAKVKAADFTAQFFVVGSEIGENRAEASKSTIQELNPNVEIIVDMESVDSKPASFFAGYDAVFASDLPLSILIKTNKFCREHSVHFYCGDAWGLYGYCFLDLLSHSCSRTKVNHKKDKEETIVENLEFCPLGPALGAKIGAGLSRRTNRNFYLMHIMNNYRESHECYPDPHSRAASIEQLKQIRTIVSKNLGFDETKITDDMLSSTFGELSPVCAAVGGMLANEIIKGISRKGIPIRNFFLFDGEECTGVVEEVYMKA